MVLDTEKWENQRPTCGVFPIYMRKENMLLMVGFDPADYIKAMRRCCNDKGAC